MDVDLGGATWRKSSYSNGTGGNCAEVADLPNGRAVRDSKHPDGPSWCSPGKGGVRSSRPSKCREVTR